MTAAQAQSTVSAAIGAGYNVQAIHQPDNTWRVLVKSGLNALDLKTISDFAVANGLTGIPEQVLLT